MGNTEIELFKQQLEKMPGDHTQLQVVDQQSYTVAGDILTWIKAGVKSFTLKKKELVDPIKVSIKNIEKEFDPTIDRAEEIAGAIRRKMEKYIYDKREKEEAAKREQARLEAERQAKMREALETGDEKKLEEAKAIEEKIAPVEAAAPKTVSGTFGKTTDKTIWTYEILAPGLVPREYCDPTPGKIQAAVRAGAREIPGVKIYEKPSISTRGQ